MGDTEQVVTTLHPQNYQDGYHVGDCYRRGNTVLMDLTAVPGSEATQLVDFAAGLVVARGGDMRRVAPRVFLLSHPGDTDHPARGERDTTARPSDG
ncbi:cell division protein SepF [Saccharopolyspora rhizosphaerae]|uniref:Cell division protein SepF n=1 Tax=Saccharopolyspora rhizosphaerae TaxID=2492662 RepID=A0A3R8NXQ0_9PSEU|nr:cell division protein SepF [Saccharopolyspora rhizosphaerae]RRO15499.1 cell division protein SepF [Saccharopolyspora rhizosphaerae]